MIIAFLKKVIYRALPENVALEQIWFLAKVDFKSRYYYHRLGILWALIRPVFELIVYYLVFKELFRTDIEHFALYVFSGLLFWYLFVEGTTKGINVLDSKRYLIESIQFKKINLFYAMTASSLLAFGFNFMAYLLVSTFLSVPFLHVGLFFLISAVLNTCLLIVGVGMLLSALSIYIKDIRHLWDMIVMAGFWLTPIVYSESMMNETLPVIKYINPMAPIVLNMHRTFLYNEKPDYGVMLYGWLLAIVLFVIGYVVFKRYSHKAAEKI